MTSESAIAEPDAAEPSKGARRREQILEAALGVFTRRGYGDAAMDEIAVESATSKGGLYFHFSSKQALFGTLLDRAADLLMSRLEAAVAGEADPLRRADAAIARALHVFGSHRRLARLFLIDAHTREFAPRLLAIRARFADRIARDLDEGVRQGLIPPCDTRLAGRIWFGAVNEVVVQWLVTPGAPPLEFHYAELRAILRRGLGAPDDGAVVGPSAVGASAEGASAEGASAEGASAGGAPAESPTAEVAAAERSSTKDALTDANGASDAGGPAAADGGRGQR